MERDNYVVYSRCRREKLSVNFTACILNEGAHHFRLRADTPFYLIQRESQPMKATFFLRMRLIHL